MTGHLDNDHKRRFGGLERLYGEGARLALHNSRMAIVGAGGVGSWVAEALARSGIGNITLIDFDHVAVSNVNRQIQALDSTLGKAKVRVLEERIRDINPACRVTAIEEFITGDNVAQLVAPGAFDVVIDTCDNARAKAALIAHARRNGIWLVVCGAAGGKINPLNLKVADLGRTGSDAMLLRVRKLLRREFNSPSGNSGKFGVTCVYLNEQAKMSPGCDANDLSCSGYGSIVTVTASIGFAAAALCVERIISSLAAQGGSLGTPGT